MRLSQPLPTRAFSGFDFDNPAWLIFPWQWHCRQYPKWWMGFTAQTAFRIAGWREVPKTSNLCFLMFLRHRMFMETFFLYWWLWSRSKIKRVRLWSICAAPVARGEWIIWLGSSSSGCPNFTSSQIPGDIGSCTLLPSFPPLSEF